MGREKVYYFTLWNTDVSVNMDATAITEELKSRGWDIKLIPSSQMKDGKMTTFNYTDVNPDEVLNIHYPAHYSDLRMVGRKSILQSVNDTTRFSDYWRERWIERNYKAFVVHNPLQYVIMNMPRSFVIPAPVFPIQQKLPVKLLEEREYTFFVHNDSPVDRRGYKEAMEIIRHFGITNNVYHSRHKPIPDEEDQKYFTRIMGDSMRTDLYNTLGNCKFLLYPTKGGAFERVVLEALAMGTVPIITEVGSAQQILLDRNDGILIPAVDLDTTLFRNQWQQGSGIQPSVKLGLPVIEKALKNPPLIDAQRYRDYYSIKRIGDLYETVLESSAV